MSAGPFLGPPLRPMVMPAGLLPGVDRPSLRRAGIPCYRATARTTGVTRFFTTSTYTSSYATAPTPSA